MEIRGEYYKCYLDGELVHDDRDYPDDAWTEIEYKAGTMKITYRYYDIFSGEPEKTEATYHGTKSAEVYKTTIYEERVL